MTRKAFWLTFIIFLVAQFARAGEEGALPAVPAPVQESVVLPAQRTKAPNAEHLIAECWLAILAQKTKQSHLLCKEALEASLSLGDLDSELAMYVNMGHIEFLAGRDEASRVWYRKALQLMPDKKALRQTALPDLAEFERRHWRPASTKVMRAWFISQGNKFFPLLHSANSLLYEGKLRLALPHWERLFALSESVLGANYPVTVTRLINLADINRTLGNYARAEALLLKTLALVDQETQGQTMATLLKSLGLLYSAQGQQEKAASVLFRAIDISERVYGPDHVTTATYLTDLAPVRLKQGYPESAEHIARRAYEIAEKRLDPASLDFSWIARVLGNILAERGHYSEAETLLSQSVTLVEKHFPKANRALANSSAELASVYLSIGQYTRAEQFLHRALVIAEQLGGNDSMDLADYADSLGYLYYTLARYESAEELYLRALGILERNLGPNDLRVARTLNNLAVLYDSKGMRDRAEPLLRRSLAILEKTGASSESIAACLTNLGGHYVAANRLSEAEAAYLDAWQRLEVNGTPEVVWNVFSHLSHFYGEQSPELGIWFGKQAVNALQEIRQINLGMDKKWQRSFTEKNDRPFHYLANLLFGQGRLAEGQAVLEMLKDAEYQSFSLRSKARDASRKKLELDEREAVWQSRYQEISKQLVSLAEEREHLSKKINQGLQIEEEKRLESLELDMAVARQAYDDFLLALKKEFTAKSKAQGRDETQRTQAERQEALGSKNLSSVRSMQGTLAELGNGAVILHYLVTEKRVWILLTTPTVQLKRETLISEPELYQLIGRFQTAIEYRSPDSMKLGKALYDILIEPVVEDLRQADAKTLMLSLDGKLRYLPMAALHDGERYLVQRYRLATYTPAATANLATKPHEEWRVAGYGMTQEVNLPTMRLNALPSVKDELEGISQELSGSIRFDGEFTARSLQRGLDSGVPVVHLASHFMLVPGNEHDSFLLTGDGKALSLQELRNFRFTGVDLLTLSACETAKGGRDANGREIEGFAVQAQEQGARSVIATLWPVEDVSTGLFMRTFYALHRANPGMTKAEAVQRTQTAFIEGRARSTLAAATRSNIPLTEAQEPFGMDHPFFWAPFILMGNWL